MLARSLDTIKLVDESVRSALSPSAEQSVAAINDLYLTRGGYTHEEVDQAGVKLMEALANEVKKVISRNTLPKVSSAVNVMTGGPSSSIPSEYRPPISGARGIQFAFSSAVPAQGTVARIYSLLLQETPLATTTFNWYPRKKKATHLPPESMRSYLLYLASCRCGLACLRRDWSAKCSSN